MKYEFLLSDGESTATGNKMDDTLRRDWPGGRTYDTPPPCRLAVDFLSGPAIDGRESAHR